MTLLARLVAVSAACALCLVFGVNCAADTVIFDSLNSNTAYGSPTAGWCVSGGATSGCGPMTTRWIAAPFTPTGNFTLTQVALDLGYLSGANGAIINLVASSAGLPGSTLLESWTLSSLSVWDTLNPPSSVLVTLPAVGTHLLDDGTQYWLETTAGGSSSTTLDVWATSSSNTNGAVLSLDGGATWVNPLTVLPGSTGALTAFEVLGTPAATPEPNSLFLTLMGISCLGGSLIKLRAARTES